MTLFDEMMQEHSEFEQELVETKEYNRQLALELEKKDKVIHEMAKELYIEGFCKNIKCKKCEAKNFVDCIKEYFYKKAKEMDK